MSDTGEPIPGQTPDEAINPADKTHVVIKEITQRDKILAEIERIVTIDDDEKRVKAEESFIKQRVTELTTDSKPTTLSLVSGSVYRGFIHPETRIMRNFLVDAVRIDDQEIYRTLLESFRQFRDNPSWQNKSMREIASHALIRTLGDYFGNHYSTSSTEEKNRQFYWDHGSVGSKDISIAEFKGKRMGVCTEKVSVAQNLLTFMGYDSEFVISTNNRLDASETDDRGGHAYILITSDKGHFIHDPTNPIMVEKEDGTVHAVLPSNYPIVEEQYQSLVKGGQVEVTHTDLIWDGKSYQRKESVKRTYVGPK